jgi:hypothetical protein
MNIAPEALDELIAIYKEEFGEEIDRREATEMAHRLLTVYRLLKIKNSRFPMEPADDLPGIEYPT